MVFILFIAFQLKHFLADFPLQIPYMLGKFRKKGWVKPLAMHCYVHAIITFIISYIYSDARSFSFCLSLGLFDFIAHFVMDRIKASPDLLGRFKPLTSANYTLATPEQRRSNWLFWQMLGVDQLWHGLTDTLIVFLLVKYV